VASAAAAEATLEVWTEQLITLGTQVRGRADRGDPDPPEPRPTGSTGSSRTARSGSGSATAFGCGAGLDRSRVEDGATVPAVEPIAAALRTAYAEVARRNGRVVSPWLGRTATTWS
jgi:hypothetical protein